MTEARTYPHGVTSWIDTEQPDVAAAATFYSGLFGWEITEARPGSGYHIATLDGHDAAALAGSEAGSATWNTYVAVDSADSATEAVRAAGGTMTSPPMEPGPAGRTASFRDPAGAPFRVWQAGRRPGVQIANTPGAWNFSDLHTPDPASALAFYAGVFGWRGLPVPGAGTMIQVPGYGDHLASTVDPDIHERQKFAPAGFADVIGGLAVSGPGEEPHWHVTFTVADRDRSAEAAEKLGATIVSTGVTTWTRTARVRDPQGAEFTLSQFTPPDGS